MIEQKDIDEINVYFTKIIEEKYGEDGLANIYLQGIVVSDLIRETTEILLIDAAYDDLYGLNRTLYDAKESLNKLIKKSDKDLESQANILNKLLKETERGGL